MAAEKRTEVFNAPIEKIYKTIIKYEDYPDFVDGVSSIDVSNQTEQGAEVQFNLNIIKTFSYRVKLTHERPNRVSWTFIDGDIFKKNNGGWTLKDLGDGTTEVTYELDLGFKVLVPSMISKKLSKSSLPSMMKAMEKRAQNA
ncbi:MAG: type II toxin-antitoxin system RatA family toxin [Bacteriovoracaceae bacterium]